MSSRVHPKHATKYRVGNCGRSTSEHSSSEVTSLSGSPLRRSTRPSRVELHLRVDGRDAIVAQVLTQGSADDIASVTADAAYDTIAIYRATVARGRSRSRVRDRTVKRVKEIGRRRWNAESGYHAQARSENAFFRYKSIIGDRLRSRCSTARQAEALIACNILNRMTALGTPASYAVGA